MKMRLGSVLVFILLGGSFLLTDVQGRRTGTKRTSFGSGKVTTKRYSAPATTARHFVTTQRRNVASPTPQRGITTQRHFDVTTPRQTMYPVQPQPMYPPPQPNPPIFHPASQPNPIYVQPKPNPHSVDPALVKVGKNNKFGKKHKNKNKLNMRGVAVGAGVGAGVGLGLGVGVGLGLGAGRRIGGRDSDEDGRIKPPYCRNWMSYIPDYTNITMLSIPGTHNSMARNSDLKTTHQEWSLKTQYKVGIRFVDIGVRFNENSLVVNDGRNEQTFLGKVLTVTFKFLQNNPTETILMRIKKVQTAMELFNPESFTQTLKRYLNAFPDNHYWMKQDFPTLEQVRGKIVILQDFEKDIRVGLDYDLIDKEDRQNDSSVTHNVDQKWEIIRNHMNAANESTDTKLYLTYTSGSNFFNNPQSVAIKMNEKFREYEFLRSKVGIVAMDFPNVRIVRKIIKSNFNNTRETDNVCRRLLSLID